MGIFPQTPSCSFLKHHQRARIGLQAPLDSLIMETRSMKRSDNMRALNEDYLRIESAILFLERNFRERPDLRTIAASVNLSEYHFQRLFPRWAGLSPKQ